MASNESIGPYGRVFGYWDPSLWPASVALGKVWGFFEETGATQNAVRWPAAIAGLLIGFVLARRARVDDGPEGGGAGRDGLVWVDRADGPIVGGRPGSGRGTGDGRRARSADGPRVGVAVGAWASLAFLAAGWPPLAVLALSTVVLGRVGSTWSWSMTIPVAATVAGWSAWALSLAPAEAWASALAMPITQPSAWGLALTALGLGLPWAPFVILCKERSIREGWPKPARSMVMGWLQVVGACLIVGMMVPGLASAALVPALAGLAVVSAGCWDRLWSGSDDLPEAVGRWATRLSLAIAGLWLIVVLVSGGYVGFAVAYYRATVIGVGFISLVGILLAIRASRLGEARWAFGAMVAVSIGLKLAYCGYYAPESNYRYGAGPWGRAIGQWVPEKHPIYVLHAWPADLAFATGRPVRQLATPQHIEFQPGEGSKFVLLQDSEYAEYSGLGPRVAQADQGGRVRGRDGPEQADPGPDRCPADPRPTLSEARSRGMTGHGIPRDSFSTIPPTPNLRASSASMSAQGMSFRPSRTSVWNRRSATSWTRWPRPAWPGSSAASTTSAASSTIFDPILAVPPWRSEAT